VFVDTDLGFMCHLPLLVLLTRWIGDKRAAIGITKYSKEDTMLLKRLVESGEFRPVIDRTYPFDQVVEATRYVETGQKTGNVVLTLETEEAVAA
jgi:NADPH:quinone reductase-like Zn-dependent oxidoreductase